jgi:multidrug efflux pump subunit AcrB
MSLHHINRSYNRCCSLLSRISIKNKRKNIYIYGSLAVIPCIILFLCGKNITLQNEPDVIYASAEFEPEKSSKAIEEELKPLIEKLTGITGVTFVRTEAHKGSADIEIGFDSKKTTLKNTASSAASLSGLLSDGFLYVPGASSDPKDNQLEIKIGVVGDDEMQCRRYAKQAAELIGNSGIADSVFLNFKKPEKEFIFHPSGEFLTVNKISIQQTAVMLRWMLFGPAADKWIQDGTETDIRIRGRDLTSADLARVENLYIPVSNSSVRVKALGKVEMKNGIGKIYRKDGRRAAFFTVETHGYSTDKITALLHQMLSSIPLEKGVGYSFPKELEMMQQQYRTLIYAYCLSIAGILILLIALTEDFKKSLLMISIIPVSSVLPLFIRFATGTALQLGDIVGMVLLSGLSINNAIYIVESSKKTIPFKIHQKIKSILVTSLTSIAGAVPLLIMSKGGFSKNLAFFMTWGILNSLFAALLLFPGVYHIFSEKEKPSIRY